ncbi:MAG: glycosyltransferase family 4 protein, partial [Thermoleophilia bacterium]
EIIHLLGAKPDTVEVVYPGIPDRKSAANDTVAAAARKPYILSVGATEPNKNFLSLLEAFSRLVQSDRSQGHRLVLAGPSGHDHPNLINFIQQQGLSDRVDLLGHVSDSMLAALYENASIFVFPSFCEGFGFPPLEAMHYGVPVAASNAPCIPEILGEVPLYFNPRNVSEMSEKMHMILSDPQLRQNIIKAGKARAREFTWENTAVKTLAVYTSLLKTMPGN